MQKLFLFTGSIAMALAVILGAFGAHALKDKMAEDLFEIFQTGVTYHFYHAIGILIVGVSAWFLPDTWHLRWSGWLMIGGIVIFSGSLYLLSLSGMRWLGAVTPIGGLCFIAAWTLLSIAVLKTQ